VVREIAWNHFPDGPYFSRETAFFEPRNTWVSTTTMQFFQELGDPVKAAVEIVERFVQNGVPNVQILNRLLALKRFLASLREPLGCWEGAAFRLGNLERDRDFSQLRLAWGALPSSGTRDRGFEQLKSDRYRHY
jgi:hypothetical protein